MGRTINIATLLLVWLSLSSCYESPYIDFHSYQELSEYNFIRNGWIPEVVGNDASNIQETYDNTNHQVFGKFDFKNRPLYDSIFKSYDPVEANLLIARIKEIKKPQYPSWFIRLDDIKNDNCVLAKHENFYLIMDKKGNSIYFLR
ncbi:MAG: hypothetical protein PHT07_14650 [Paludibacter sp.]|nr:hypothetical protein [Paludibacter sp.]